MENPAPYLETADDWFVTELVPLQSRLYRYIATLVAVHADAEDLFQKTCLTAWQERRRFEVGRDFYAWLCGVARNHVRHYYRSQQRDRVYLDPDVVEQLAERLLQEDDYFQSRQQALAGCLDKLPQRQKQLIENYYQNGQTVKTYAAARGQAAEATYKMLQRIRAALHACIEATLAREGT